MADVILYYFFILYFCTTIFIMLTQYINYVNLFINYFENSKKSWFIEQWLFFQNKINCPKISDRATIFIYKKLIICSWTQKPPVVVLTEGKKAAFKTAIAAVRILIALIATRECVVIVIILIICLLIFLINSPLSNVRVYPFV